MTQERVITWDFKKKRRRPIAKTLMKTAQEFFGPRGPSIEGDPDHLYIAYSKEYWIEIELSPGQVSVVTRMRATVDQTTAAAVWNVADRLALHIASKHKGEYIKPQEPRFVRAERERRVEEYLADTDVFYDDPDFD